MGYLFAALLILFAMYEWGGNAGPEDGASGDGDPNSAPSAPSTGGVSGWIQKMAAAITHNENSNPAYNNPGSIQGTGDTGTTAKNGLGIFSSIEAGEAALVNLIASYARRFPNLSVNEFVSRWVTGKTDSDAPPGSALSNYQNSVAGALGVDGDTPISDLGSGADDSDP